MALGIETRRRGKRGHFDGYDGSPLSPAGWAPELRKAKVYEQILLDVILGELPPGSRLDEQALVRRYAAGLAGVRDALGRLALEGLVARKPRAGTTVAPLDLIEVRQAFEARRLIEPHCAALAATHATPADIAALQGAFAGGAEAARIGDSRALVGMDQRFHAAIARASRNPTLAQIVIPLQHKAARFWVYSMVEDTEAERMAEIARHQVVIDCIASHDAEAARAAMLGILGVFTDNVKRSVANGTATDPHASASLA
ncbi:MAG TPA: GntR family transcriptional regulator [Caulobacteraceae bacterium]|jgi:DNA-binding GntR family transcriptional regulator|nr:GntR family transcriptional regulator [Caulobacteraceae bacterium]